MAGSCAAHVGPLAKPVFGLGVEGPLKDAPRPGRTREISRDIIGQLVASTTQSKAAGATHWSRSSMACAMGISESSVRRIWRAHGLKPHRVETFKGQQRSTVRREAGSHRRPVSESARACPGSLRRREEPDSGLDRTQPGLPMKKGRGADA